MSEADAIVAGVVADGSAAAGDGPAGAWDEAGPVRAEDAFDVGQVDAWLRRHLADGGGDGQPLPPGLPRVFQFGGGRSNLTYLLRYPGRDLVLRRPPAGRKAGGAHDMAREYRVQRALKPVFPYVPTMVAFCDDPAVLGGGWYVMERLDGVIPRQDLPPELAVDEAGARRLALRVFDLLVTLHQVDPAAAGLAGLGRGPGYVRRQVDGWSRRYRQAMTDNVPSCAEVMAWLEANAPDDVGSCVIHNDFRLDNVVFDPAPARAGGEVAVVGVLDWEMATIGDPLMELGSALAYWVQADDDEIRQLSRRQPSNVPGMPTRAEIVDHYCAATGLSARNWPFYEAFGLFRLAVIVQQIYYRYHHGQTTNPVFRDYWVLTGYLAEAATRAMRG
ncbi:MAG: phosphotransferase family protein [Frankia sp.]|nr:phosphotransferase family protein [Frankia sp.]